MPHFTETRYVLAVHSVKKSAEYYRDVLGFTVHEMGDPGWRFLVREACAIMIGECPRSIAPHDLGDHAYFAYIVVDEIERLYAKVKERGGVIRAELAERPWGMKEFALETIDGHRIMFGAPTQTLIAPN